MYIISGCTQLSSHSSHLACLHKWQLLIMLVLHLEKLIMLVLHLEKLLVY